MCSVALQQNGDLEDLGLDRRNMGTIIGEHGIFLCADTSCRLASRSDVEDGSLAGCSVPTPVDSKL